MLSAVTHVNHFQIVDSGSMAAFNCSAHGGRGQLSITWLKNGSPLSLSSKIEVQTNGESLVIRSVERDDRGMYQCFVRGGDESAQNSAELILGGRFPPVLLHIMCTNNVNRPFSGGLHFSLRTTLSFSFSPSCLFNEIV